MDIGWDDRLWAIAVPLIILAVDAARRAVIHLLLSWKAAAWWNQVVMNSHDKKHDEFEREQARLDAIQDAGFTALDPPDDAKVLVYIAQELTRMRQRLDVMRIEDHARYEATSSRSQFSDLRIVWLWLRTCGNPNVTLDGGTTRRFMERADVEARAQTRDGSGTDPTEGSAGEISGTSTTPPNVPPTAIAVPAQSMIVLPAPTVLITEQLERLVALRERGALTPEEFAKMKAVLLDL